MHIPIPDSRFQFHDSNSLRILDRNGILLRELLSANQGYGRWSNLNAISPLFLESIVAVEDKRFYSHRGIDPLAILRATWLNIRAGRVVSGGSTISQQTIRQLYDIKPTFAGKIKEAWLALRLENTLNKRDILAHYVNRIPFGNQCFGVEAAARFYFDRPALHLSLAQASLLAALPQAPSKLNPLRHQKRARRRQRQVLQALLASGKIDATMERSAQSEKLDFNISSRAFRAPHAVDMVLTSLRGKAPQEWPETIILTLDYHLQERIHATVKTRVEKSAHLNITNAAVVVVDNRDGKILALEGSADYFSEDNHGQVNGATALRQPGSTLKPFTYLLALQNGFTPSSILPDIPLKISASGGDFTPKNYDNSHHGPIPLRQALACSYNIPAVYLAHQLSGERLLHILKQAGFSSLQKSAQFYGMGLTLGNGEVHLLELVKAYAGLANDGLAKGILLSQKLPVLPESLRRENRFAQAGFSQLITNILADNSARVPAFGEFNDLDLPFDCAAKTGTSKDYRDNWTVGYTADYTVGVWVGNFNGEAMRKVSGISGAGPLFRAVVQILHTQKAPPPFQLSKVIKTVDVCIASGLRPQPFCPNTVTGLFHRDVMPKSSCTHHQLQINPATQKRDVALVLPDKYREWAHTNGIHRFQFSGTDNAVAVETGESNGPRHQPLKILTPKSGSIYKIDPTLRLEFQKIQLFAAVPEHIKEITWYVDDKIIAERDAPPFGKTWQLQPGIHKISVSSTVPPVQSDSIFVQILH